MGASSTLLHDLGPQGLVAGQFQLVDRLLATEEGHAAAGHDALFQRRLGGVLGVFHQGLPLLHFGFGRRADVDLGDAAGQLRQPLFQLLAVVIAGGGFDLLADLVGPALDGRLRAGAADDRRIVAT